MDQAAAARHRLETMEARADAVCGAEKPRRRSGPGSPNGWQPAAGRALMGSRGGLAADRGTERTHPLYAGRKAFYQAQKAPDRSDVLAWALPVLHATAREKGKEYRGNDQIEYNTTHLTIRLTCPPKTALLRDNSPAGASLKYIQIDSTHRPRSSPEGKGQRLLS